MEFCQECLTPIECEKHGGCVGPAGVNKERAEMRAALEKIALMHPGDQPASSALTEEQWLRKHIVEMRVLASNAITANF